MEFVKYQHVERFGTEEVEGIELGTCLVFPKVDGTNAQVFLKNGEVCAGSRNRELTLEKDNAGFFSAIKGDEKVIAYLNAHPNHRLFGEWLVPHSLKTYRDDAWRKFYIFDVCVDKEDGTLEYLPYDVYKPLIDEYELDYIPPIRIVKNGDYESFIRCVEENKFLIKDGSGKGEGVVIKNYDFYNKYRRQTWAKIVTSEFKERHIKEMGAPITEHRLIEEQIVDDFVTTAFVDKEYSKIKIEKEGWRSRYIPMLLGRTFHELINEESWNILRKYDNPTINFKRLNHLVVGKVKEVKPEIFS